jgi:hypothetical protein
MGQCGRIAAREKDRRPDAILRRENFLSGRVRQRCGPAYLAS